MSASSSDRPGPDVPVRPSSSPTDRQFAANLQLPRGSVITGTVVDEYGEPTPGTQVRVMRYVVQAGRRTLQQTGNGATDDRGIYRVYGLQPGEYIVSAVPRNAGPSVDVGRLQAELAQVREQVAGAIADAAAARELATRAMTLQGQLPSQDEQTTGYSPVYFPGTVSAAQAGTVTLNLGEERTGVDFQLQRVAMARIDGIVVNSTGQATDNVQITLTRSLGANGRCDLDGGARRQRGSLSPQPTCHQAATGCSRGRPWRRAVRQAGPAPFGRTRHAAARSASRRRFACGAASTFRLRDAI